jgi:hypothetical protein
VFEDNYDPDTKVQDERFDRPEADSFTAEGLDNYLLTKVLLPRGDGKFKGTVVGRKKGNDGNPIGLANSNPILDTREYEVEFPDGSLDTYTANVIAENLYALVDDEGHETLVMQDIIDHRKDGSAVSHDDAYVVDRHGSKKRRLTTQGWKLLVQWKDGTTSWEP